jgi:hypothetical protein
MSDKWTRCETSNNEAMPDPRDPFFERDLRRMRFRAIAQLVTASIVRARIWAADLLVSSGERLRPKPAPDRERPGPLRSV